MFRRVLMTGSATDGLLELGVEPDGRRVSIAIRLDGGLPPSPEGNTTCLRAQIMASAAAGVARTLNPSRVWAASVLMEFAPEWALQLESLEEMARAFATVGVAHFIGKSGNTYMAAGFRLRSFVPTFWPCRKLEVLPVDVSEVRSVVSRLVPGPEWLETPRVRRFLEEA